MWERLAIQCETVSLPTKGTLTLITGPGKGSKCDWTYTPGPNWKGTDSMTYRIAYTNSSGLRTTTSPANVTLSGPPITMPTLANDNVTFTNVAATRNFGVKANDHDASLTAAGLPLNSVTGNAAWDALAVMCKVATPPANGSLTLITGAGYGSECDWTYTPKTSFTGTDSMTYKMEYKNTAGNRVLTAATATVNFTGPVGTTASPKFVPLSPARLLETRPGNITIDGKQQGQGTSAAGSTTEVQITGRATVPTDATAVVLNVTATGTKQPGFLTVYPCGQTIPTASNLNYGNDTTIANAVTTKIGTSGKICIYTSAETNLITDINGYYPA
jgi:hypothetical protein